MLISNLICKDTLDNDLLWISKTVGIVKEGKIVNVEEIASLRKKQLKKVSILFPVERNITDLDIDGIGPVASGRTKNLVFLYSGDVNALIGRLSLEQVDNLTIEEPPLEEIFLHYYQ